MINVDIIQHGFVMCRYSLEDARHVKRAIELFRDKQLCFCNGNYVLFA
jgi:hypothetical protein